MLKCDELRNSDSCLNKAASSEPLFVLRAKDPLAPQTIRLWVHMSRHEHEPTKVAEALKIAEEMEKYRRQYHPALPMPTDPPNN